MTSKDDLVRVGDKIIHLKGIQTVLLENGRDCHNKIEVGYDNGLTILIKFRDDESKIDGYNKLLSLLNE